MFGQKLNACKVVVIDRDEDNDRPHHNHHNAHVVAWTIVVGCHSSNESGWLYASKTVLSWIVFSGTVF